MKYVIAGFLLTFLLFLGLSLAGAACTPAQLMTEMTTDPNTLGYATAYGKPISANSVGNDQAVLDVLNLTRSGNQYKVNKGTLTGIAFSATLNAAEFPSLTPTQLQQIQMMFQLGVGQIDVSQQNVQDIFDGIFTQAAFPLTRSALKAAVFRQGSRSEVLCGVQSTLSDVSYAIRGVK